MRSILDDLHFGTLDQFVNFRRLFDWIDAMVSANEYQTWDVDG
jgi:hypothetical protein